MGIDRETSGVLQTRTDTDIQRDAYMGQIKLMLKMKAVRIWAREGNSDKGREPPELSRDDASKMGDSGKSVSAADSCSITPAVVCGRIEGAASVNMSCEKCLVGKDIFSNSRGIHAWMMRIELVALLLFFAGSGCSSLPVVQRSGQMSCCASLCPLWAAHAPGPSLHVVFPQPVTLLPSARLKLRGGGEDTRDESHNGMATHVNNSAQNCHVMDAYIYTYL